MRKELNYEKTHYKYLFLYKMWMVNASNMAITRIYQHFWV